MASGSKEVPETNEALPSYSHHEMPPGGEFQTIIARGMRLRVYTRGLDLANKTPLVFCNGLGQAVEILFPLMEEFPDRPVIAFDAAGVGLSEVPDQYASIADHALMLAALLRRLKVDQCDVLGISWEIGRAHV